MIPLSHFIYLHKNMLSNDYAYRSMIVRAIDHIIIKASRDIDAIDYKKQNYRNFMWRMAFTTTGILAITIVLLGIFIETASAASMLILSVFFLWVVLMYVLHKLHISGDTHIELKHVEKYRAINRDFDTIKFVDNPEFYELLNEFIIKHRDILSEYWVINIDIGD